MIDKLIGVFSPRVALERQFYRDLQSSYRGGLDVRTNGRSWGASESRNGIKIPRTVDQRAMRDRARNLDRNDALASSVLDRAVENVIGTGIRICPSTDNPDFNEEVSHLWADWHDNCDIRGMFDFCTLQQLTYRSLKRDGDVGTLLVDRGGLPFLQAIEGDYIESPAGKQNSAMVDGVELNSVGAPTRFYIRVQDPNKPLSYKHTPVSIRDFIFLTNSDRLSGVRGASQFAQGFELFDFIHGYLEATVLAARAAASFSLIVKRANAAGVFGNLPTGTNSSGETQRKLRIEPATVQYLQPGDDITQIDPKHPTQSFPEAIAAFSRFVGLKFGITLEQVMLDFSRTNYSSSRAARLQAQQTAEMEQRRFAAQYCSRIYQWWLSKTVNAGLIKTKPPELYWKHEWIPQGKPWVDPTKELDAAEKSIQLGLDARTFIASSMGYDFKKLCEQNEADNQLMADHGLTSQVPEQPQPQNNQQVPPDEQQNQDDTGEGNDTMPAGNE